MVKRGSITVFLALTLGLILALLSSGLESARMAAARTQILNGMDIGLYSLFGQYNKSLLKDFDLFAVDGACGGKEMNLASVYDNLESYMKPVMKQNSQKLSVQQGGISGYLLMTDSDGEVFYQQAVQYMKETLGSHGAKLLLNKIRDMQKKTIEAERQGNEIESKGTIENYESEMDSAQQKSQALLEEKKKQAEMTGKQSIRFDEAVHLLCAASIAGKKEGEGPLGDRFDQLVRGELCAAGVGLVATGAVCAADRAGAFDVAVRQGAAGGRGDGDFLGALVDVAVFEALREQFLHDLFVIAGGGAGEQIVAQAEIA